MAEPIGAVLWGNATHAQRRKFVDSFADAKDDKGKQLHPHFDEVAQQMAGMVQSELASGREVDLAKLYEQACWAVPSVREKLLASRTNGTSRATEQGRDQRARRAAGSLTGTGTRSSEQEQPDVLEEALRANMRSMLSDA